MSFNNKSSQQRGNSTYRNIDTNSTGANVKATSGVLHWYYLSNSGAAAAFVKFYDQATAANPASATPKLTIEIPAASAANCELGPGMWFGTGITVRACTGVGDTNAVSPGANEVKVNLLYY